MKFGLGYGEHLSGFLIDGVEDTPYVVASLVLGKQGLEATVPYIQSHADGYSQFAEVAPWFEKEHHEIPERLLFQAQGGSVLLIGTSYRGSRQNLMGAEAEGRLAAREAVVGVGLVDEALSAYSLRSRIEGLSEWTYMTAKSSKLEQDKNGLTRRLAITYESPPPVTWQDGQISMSLEVDWGVAKSPDEWVSFVTTSRDELAPGELLKSHITMRSLLTLVFGKAAMFQDHHLESSAFTETLPSGYVHKSRKRYVSARTLGDEFDAHELKRKYDEPLVSFQSFSIAGLESWTQNYGTQQWQRVVLPLVSLLRRQRFVEDEIISSSMCLEARGHMLRPLSDEPSYGTRRKPPVKKLIQRCLRDISADFGGVAESEEGLAAAIADFYNGIKHADRGPMPDPFDAGLIGRLALLIARLCVLNMIDPSGALVKEACVGREYRRAVDSFELNGRYIASDGSLQEWPTV